MEFYDKFKLELLFKKEDLKIKYGDKYKIRYFKILKRDLNKYLGYDLDKVGVIMKELYEEGIIAKTEYEMYESDCDITVTLLEKLNSGIVEQILKQTKN